MGFGQHIWVNNIQCTEMVAFQNHKWSTEHGRGNEEKWPKSVKDDEVKSDKFQVRDWVFVVRKNVVCKHHNTFL